LQLFILLFQCRQLHASIFILSKRRDGLTDFFRIDLCDEINRHDDRISIERRASLLIEHEDQSGRVGTDLVLGDIHPVDDRDAFQVGRDLFERAPFSRFGGKSDCIFPRIAVPHPILSLSRDNPQLCQCRGGDQEGSDKEDRRQRREEAGQRERFPGC